MRLKIFSDIVSFLVHKTANGFKFGYLNYDQFIEFGIDQEFGGSIMSHTSYAGDPKIMFAKFSSVCPKCNKKINKSDRIVYFPNGKKAFCYSCGEQDYLDFVSSAIDEDNFNRGYC